MILCRFADQTAVQLPPERRLIGMNFCSCCVNYLSNEFTLMYKGKSNVYEEDIKLLSSPNTWKIWISSHFTSCFSKLWYRHAFLLSELSVWDRGFTFCWVLLLHLVFFFHHSLKIIVFVKFTKILLLPVYLILKAQAICNSDLQHAALVLPVIVCCSSLWGAKSNGNWKQSG